ncbi:V-type proton ATPase subunit d2 [Salvia divinorum]|uniref:V-type proton ATPase subunit d2 n=1 Tax=Salvia divinorum TaxID=28513 RepID=A0ABD1II46_SALDI
MHGAKRGETAEKGRTNKNAFCLSPLPYITYGHMIDNVVLIVTGTLHERDVQKQDLDDMNIEIMRNTLFKRHTSRISTGFARNTVEPLQRLLCLTSWCLRLTKEQSISDTTPVTNFKYRVSVCV